MKRPHLLLCLLAALAASATAQSAPALAPAPPLGWNSWDSYGLTITEPQFKANVAWFHQHLQPYGWQYVVVDEGWYLAHPDDSKAPGFTLSLSTTRLGILKPWMVAGLGRPAARGICPLTQTSA